MRKQYLSAPLPFVGQKRMFAREFIKVLKQYPEDTVFVDLFGGSGLLSHITKCQKPNATVIYNDFDGYRNRLQHIPQTMVVEFAIILSFSIPSTVHDIASPIMLSSLSPLIYSIHPPMTSTLGCDFI